MALVAKELTLRKMLERYVEKEEDKRKSITLKTANNSITIRFGHLHNDVVRIKDISAKKRKGRGRFIPSSSPGTRHQRVRSRQRRWSHLSHWLDPSCRLLPRSSWQPFAGHHKLP